MSGYETSFSDQEYITYEITMRRDATDQPLVLESLANTFGWNARQRITLPTDLETDTPSSWQITEEQLTRLSRELWGSERYGKAAESLLDSERNRTPYFIDQSGFTNLQYSSAGRSSTSAELRAKAWKLWNTLHQPFAPNIVAVKEGSREEDESLEVRRGGVTRERLVDYLRHQGYADHTLRGSIGKMFDVLNVAGGIKSRADIVPTNVDCGFVEHKELQAMLRTGGLSRHYRHELRHKIRKDIGHQLWTGQPAETGEIILEGDLSCKSDWANGSVVYEQIATTSLANLASGFKKGSPLESFLQQFL